MSIYAGINSPLNAPGKLQDIGPSFMIYGRYNISDRWQAEIGFGGVFYYGKSMGYLDSKNIYDTLYIKNSTISGIAYTTVPIIIKYKLFNRNISILAGLRWLGASSVFGNGSYGIYSPAHKDSFIFKSNIIPNLPESANFMDVQGIAGLELSFSKHFSASLIVNVGFIPIFPGNLTKIIAPLSGNYNDSIELGLNYTFLTP